MPYQYNCNEKSDYFKENKGRGNAVKRHCGHDHSSGSDSNIKFY